MRRGVSQYAEIGAYVGGRLTMPHLRSVRDVARLGSAAVEIEGSVRASRMMKSLPRPYIFRKGIDLRSWTDPLNSRPPPPHKSSRCKQGVGVAGR